LKSQSKRSYLSSKQELEELSMIAGKAFEYSVTAGATATIVVPASATRIFLLVQNQSATETVVVGFSATPLIKLRAGETLVMDNPPRDGLYLARSGSVDAPVFIIESKGV
jgi:hypothetical protein